MKKILVILFILAAIFIMFGCQKKSPSAPVATATPNATQTAIALQTAGLTAQQTATAQAQQTIAAQAQQTTTAQAQQTTTTQAQQTATTRAQETAIAKIIQTATAKALQTAGLTAQETATAQAIQTATAQVVQTATAQVVQTATARVIQTQTAVAAAATQTAVVGPVQTAVAAEALFDSSVIVSVPGGTFIQTDDTGTNSFSHTISAFKMGKYQVTYNLWYIVYQWAVSHGYTFANAGIEGCCGATGVAPTAAKDNPVTTVNWRDAIVWCNAFSQKLGLSPVYCSDASFTTAIKTSSGGIIDTTAGSVDNPYVNWNTNGYRLPTEGEYQYAASYIDGTNWTPYNYASGATADYTNEVATDLVGWDNVNSAGTTHAVGGLTANALGIYDMSGNVYEWCWDWYDVYPGTAQTNYRGPTSSPYSGRVIRGGLYIDVASRMQVGFRSYYYYPYLAYSISGFRFARTN
jgi:formylglycine-generating enzyme required for sulfatase activity